MPIVHDNSDINMPVVVYCTPYPLSQQPFTFQKAWDHEQKSFNGCGEIGRATLYGEIDNAWVMLSKRSRAHFGGEALGVVLNAHASRSFSRFETREPFSFDRKDIILSYLGGYTPKFSLGLLYTSGRGEEGGRSRVLELEIELKSTS